MLTPWVEEFFYDYHYGLGIYINQTDQGREYIIMGDDPGVGFFSCCSEDRGFELTILSNQSHITWDILEYLLNHVL